MLEWEALGIVVFIIYCLSLLFFRLSPTLPILPPVPKVSQERDFSWDFLRGFAIVGIVCIHIHSYFLFFHPEKNWVTAFTLFLANASRFSVPVFVFASGLFFQRKDGYWSSKAKGVLLPYGIACILAYPTKHWGVSLADFGLYVLLGEVFTPYYFIPLLFQFYGIAFLLPSSFGSSRLCLALLPFSFILQFFSNLGFWDSFLPDFYRTINVLNFIFFFHLGYLTKKIQNSVSNPLSRNSILITLVLLFAMLFCSSIRFMEFHNHHIAYPLFMMSFLWILFSFLKSRGANYFLSGIAKLGKESLFIFLFHPFVIHAMHRIDPFVLGGPLLAYAITLFLNLYIPLLVPFTISSVRNRS